MWSSAEMHRVAKAEYTAWQKAGGAVMHRQFLATSRATISRGESLAFLLRHVKRQGRAAVPGDGGESVSSRESAADSAAWLDAFLS